MKNKKVYYGALVFLLLIFVVSTTYAFFAPQAGGSTSTNATVTSNTTDLLTFSINRDISFTVTQADFEENGENQSGDATATATLTPNNKTGAATMNYYLYLNIESNPTVYSAANTNEDPELMLQVFDGNNQLVTLTGLGTQKTIKGVTGYDITGVEGLQTLLDNHEISASNNTATIENWRVVITLINLDVNQNDNTGLEISAEIKIQQDNLSLAFNGNGIIYRNNIFGVYTGDSYVDSTKNVYCMIKDGENGCTSLTGREFYLSQVICQNHISGSNTCEAGTVVTKLGQYTENANAIRQQTNYYLKHNVQNNIINQTDTCLWYNNHEFCFNPDYWSSTATTTMNKLQNDMELSLNTSATSCSIDGDIVTCTFGDNYCSISEDGGTACGSSPKNTACFIWNDDYSSCDTMKYYDMGDAVETYIHSSERLYVGNSAQYYLIQTTDGMDTFESLEYCNNARLNDPEYYIGECQSELIGVSLSRAYAALEQERPGEYNYFMKLIFVDEILYKMESCVYYNNNSKCFDTDYWDTDAATTKNKVQADLASIGVIPHDFEVGTNVVYAYFYDHHYSSLIIEPNMADATIASCGCYNTDVEGICACW